MSDKGINGAESLRRPEEGMSAGLTGGSSPDARKAAF